MTWDPPRAQPSRTAATVAAVVVVGLILATALAGVVKLWMWVL